MTGAEAMAAALHVITDDLRISGWLVKNDPKALTQAHEALIQFQQEAENSEVFDPQGDGSVIEYRGVTYVPHTEDEDDEYDHCEDDGSGYCTLHNSPIVSTSPEPPYDVCEERANVLVERDAERIRMDPDLLAAFNELVEVEAVFEANGGRGIEDAERIDELRLLLYPETGDGPFAGPA